MKLHITNLAIGNSDRLIRLINDMLDIERIESGRATMETRPTDAVQFIKHSVESMAASADAAHVTIVTNVEPCCSRPILIACSRRW